MENHERPNEWLLGRALFEYSAAAEEAEDALSALHYSAEIARTLYERYGISTWEFQAATGEIPRNVTLVELVSAGKTEIDIDYSEDGSC